jgi:fucose 4-O-acetylase-like acetyltransferase
MARGAAIVMVVLGHVWRGLAGGGLIVNEGLFRHVDQAIYLFHMPVFFILSGFVFRSGGHLTPIGFLKGRVRRILYPLLLWYYLFVSLNILMSPYVNTAFDLDRLLGLPVPFGTQFWFLYALLVIQLACMPLAFASTRRQILGFVLLATCAALLHKYGFGFFNPWLHQAISYLPFFLLGVFAKEIVFQNWLFGVAPRNLVLWGGGMFLLAELLRLSGAPVPAPLLLLGMPAAIGFILIIAGISFFPAQGRVSTVLMILGQASMAIYLAHVFFTAFSRVALQAVGVQDLWAHLLLGTLLGVIGPLVLLSLADKLSLRRILGF